MAFLYLFFPECATTFPWRKRGRLPITLWLHLLQGLNLNPSWFAFGYFQFLDSRSCWGSCWKRGCTCWSGCKAKGGTSPHPDKVWTMDRFDHKNPICLLDCRFYQCFESIQLYGVSLVQLVDDLEGGRLVKNKRTWKYIPPSHSQVYPAVSWNSAEASGRTPAVSWGLKSL